MPIPPKRINVHNDRFEPASTDLNKNQDSVIFVKVGDRVPGTLTASAGLFAASSSSCNIGVDASSATAYTPLGTASGNYSITVDVPSTKATIVSGTIKVSG
jgi:hypothetical protein